MSSGDNNQESDNVEVGSMTTRDNDIYFTLQDIIGTDAGHRGMKPLIVPGDLQQAAQTLSNLPLNSHVVILSGFPCCVSHNPPTETDGPPGTMAIARAAAMLGCRVTIVTETCHQVVFAAALEGLAMPTRFVHPQCATIKLECFPSEFSEEDEERFQNLARCSDLLISCERVGEAQDGICYTMRGINMNEKELIGPLNRLVQECKNTTKFIAIGDGGNELGMGKVYERIVNNPQIWNGKKIGCVIPADYLIAASVSNWGAYALAAASAMARTQQQRRPSNDAFTANLANTTTTWLELCVPTVEEEVALLHRCVDAGCRDGVSGKMEATVDGLPLEKSMTCLQEIRQLVEAAVNQQQSQQLK
jgi:D-glutamate cyclase